MNAYRMKPLAFPWPPLIYGAAIAAAFLLQAYFPLAVAETNIWIARAAGGDLIGDLLARDPLKSIHHVQHAGRPSSVPSSPARRGATARVSKGRKTHTRQRG